MRKIVTISVLVVVMLAMVVTPALAGNGGGGNGGGGNGGGGNDGVKGGGQGGQNTYQATRFALVAEVVAFDGDTVSVTVLNVGPRVGEIVAVGDTVDIELSAEGTRIREYGAAPGVVVAPEDWADHILEGVLVSVRGTMLDGVFSADGMTLNVPFTG